MPHRLAKSALVVAAVAVTAALSFAQEGNSVEVSPKVIEKGAKIFIAPIEGGLDTFLTAGIIKKQVPVVVVTDRAKAEFEITGISDSEKAGWAKMLFLGSEQSRELASIKVVDIKTGDVVYAYSVHEEAPTHGPQSSAESCAKHLKNDGISSKKEPSETKAPGDHNLI